MAATSEIKPARLLDGLRKRDHRVLTQIYKRYYPIVLGYILQNSGGESDAKDIFQESIIVIYKLSDDKDFYIKEEFASLLMGIAKRIWLKQIRRNSIHERYVSQSDENEFENHPSEVELENELELALIRKHILILGEDCRNILLWSADGVKNEEIASRMSYKSEKTVRTKKYKCKEALIKLIKRDPDFIDRDR